MIDRYLVGATMLAIVAAAPAAPAQTLADRIAAVGDGTIRMSFPARPGVCGYGDGTRVFSRSRPADDWEPDCEPGPVRVVVRRAGGRVVEVETYIGGRWRSGPSATDLGTVSAGDAADHLLDIASRGSEDVAKDALFAAAVADAGPVWRRMATLAADADRPEAVRASALFWVGHSSAAGALGAIEPFLDDPNPTLRERALFAISQHESDRADRRLRELAADVESPHAVRDRALFWLGQRRDEGSVDFLRRSYATFEDTELRERVLFALSQTRGVGNDAWLAGVAANPDELERLRERAIFWLSQMRGSTPLLIDLYRRVEGRPLRERVIFGLSQRHRDQEAVDRLIEIAQSDPDRELRKKAIFWLGHSNDPRAVRFLAELINR